MGRKGRFPKRGCQDFNVMYDRTQNNHSTLFHNRDLLRGRVRQVLFQLGASPDKEQEQAYDFGNDYMLIMPAKNNGLVTVLVQNSHVIFHFTVIMDAKPEGIIKVMQTVFRELEEESFELAVAEYQKTGVAQPADEGEDE
jgi:hypothetical protein